MKKKIVNLFKIIFSVFFLFFIFKRINYHEVLSIIYKLDTALFILGISLTFINILILSARPVVLLNLNGKIYLTLSKSFLYYLYSAFYSNFLPSLIGGDVFRVLHLSSNGSGVMKASAVVVLERINGLLIMLSLAIISICTVFNNYLFAIFAVICLMILYSFYAIILFSKKQVFSSNRVAKRENVLSNLLLKGFRFIELVKSYRDEKKTLGSVAILTLIAQLGDILVTYIYGKSLHINISFYYYLAFIPIMYVVTMLPISINGLGLREGIVIFLFAKAGVSESQALVLSFLIYFDKIVKGMAGGILLLFSNLANLKSEIKEKNSSA